MPTTSLPMSVAVVGAGMAGAACAQALSQAGIRVTVFDKSRAPGGRMATRAVQWTDAAGQAQTVHFDHGTPWFSARRPRFRAAVARAQAAGALLPWRQHVHAAWPAPSIRHGFCAVPGMPGFAAHLLHNVEHRLGNAVQRLHRTPGGWELVLADGTTAGPFGQVVLALPPAQAAGLVAGHHDAWADTLERTPVAPCWTLMALTDDLPWPWDAAEPLRGPLARVLRGDRSPGRSAPPGCATWIAHASAQWSAAHLEDDPADVMALLQQALAAELPHGVAPAWHHAAVHRWRYAYPAPPASGTAPYLWDAGLGLGVCGDGFAGGTVEGAWTSGDELADELAAFLDGNAVPDASQTDATSPAGLVAEAGKTAPHPSRSARPAARPGPRHRPRTAVS